MTAFAAFRLPHEDCYTLVEQTEGTPAEFLSCTSLNGQQGFVVAPFQITPSQPVLLIRPDRMEQVPLTLPQPVAGIERRRDEKARMYYAVDFANFHSQLELGTFQKIVLARCADEEMSEQTDPMQLFLRACQCYPRMFIALVYTERSGWWLTATPEILLEGNGHDWRTIALAGTMKLEGDQLDGEGEAVTWSIKNIQEQRIVTTYITECLERFTSDFHEEGPRTVRAANLVHLRSDFTFTLPDDSHIGDLLHALHPTPAVCGLPKRDTFSFIVSNEHTPRRYYSGFMGPLSINHSPSSIVCPPKSTHLYVSLRCMNIEGRSYHLYAGGGLLKDSTEEQEWLETEAKLETMRRLLS